MARTSKAQKGQALDSLPLTLSDNVEIVENVEVEKKYKCTHNLGIGGGVFYGKNQEYKESELPKDSYYRKYFTEVVDNGD